MSVFLRTVALTFREHFGLSCAVTSDSAADTVEDMAAQKTTPGTEHGQSEQPTAELGADVMAKACASRSVLHHVTGRWGALTMVALSRSEGPARFGELRRAIEGISDRMLSQTLSKLEHDGLVVRTVHSAIPPHVDYALTELGTAVAEPLIALITTIEADLPAVLEARKEHDDCA